MRIELAYSRRRAEIEVPDSNLVAVIRPEWPAVLARPQASVTEALRRPAAGPCQGEAGPPLAEVLRQRAGPRDRSANPDIRTSVWSNFKAVLLVSDLTRPCPNHDILAPILAELRQGGIPPECVTILIATGLHAPVTGKQTERLLGADIVAACRVVNHFGHRGVTLKRLGRTEAGTPVVLSREWVGADLRIATGVIEPHLMAGFSGGRKAVCPGIAGAETVMAWHSPKFLEQERVRPGRLDGNPEHAEALAVADFAPPHFIVNVTVDREGGMTGVFAGQMRAAHEAGVEFLRRHIERPVPEPCDILVTTSGGRPLDATFYGAEKGLLTGLPILKAGGTFLWAAACEDGLGGPEFTDLVMRYRTLDEFRKAVTAEGAAVTKDQWALENLAKAARHAEILFWSDALPPETQQRLFVTPVRSLEEGLRRAFEKHGPAARVVVSPQGPYVLPYVKNSN